MEEEISLRVAFSPSDKALLGRLAKVRGTSETQAIRDFIHLHYNRLLERLDPDAIEQLEAGELDRRGLALALHRHKQRKQAVEHPETAA
jgi:hypothetical protein